MTVERLRRAAKLPPKKTLEEALLDRPAPSQRARLDMHNANALKLGLFGVNCSSGRAVTTVDERWSGSWRDNLALAIRADAAGIDFLLPVARWKGYGGDTDYQGTTLETLTWAAGLLAASLYTPYRLMILALCALLVFQNGQAHDWAQRPLKWRQVALLVPLFLVSLVAMFAQHFNPFLYFQF